MGKGTYLRVKFRKMEKCKLIINCFIMTLSFCLKNHNVGTKMGYSFVFNQ